MPYNPDQCAKFAAMAAGKAEGTPPADWRKHCSSGAKKKPEKKMTGNTILTRGLNK